MLILSVFLLVLFVYTLLSRRLEGTVFTPPIIFASTGILAFLALPIAGELELDRETFLRIAEVGLVLVLFTDAARINLRVLRGNESLPGRLLAIGMPLTILLGAVAGALVLRPLTFWEAGILAAILAPTDAGLGEVIVTSPLVPVRIRQALNVEAGLNDGMSVPFLFFFLLVAQAGARGTTHVLLTYGVQQLGFGAVVGVAVGLAGGWLMHQALHRRLMDQKLKQVALLALPLLCIILAEPIGGSIFIAAFVAGLSVQLTARRASERPTEFASELGQVLDYFVFFFFGLLATAAWPRLTWSAWLYALLSLTVVRGLPVALALLRSGLSRPTLLFMSWFGPRGLASIVLGMVYLAQQAALPGESIIIAAVVVTVLTSIFAHGISAVPGIARYARSVAALDPAAPEFMDVVEDGRDTAAATIAGAA